MPNVDYYNVLGVQRTARESEIRAAYHRLAMRWHPDKNPDIVEEATSKFRLISEAYRVLTDIQKRRAYDNELAFQTFVSTIFRPAEFLTSRIYTLSGGPPTLLDVAVNVAALSFGTYCLLSLISDEE